MTADPTLSRRVLLAGGVALGTAIAGCSGSEAPDDTPEQSGTSTAGGTPTSADQTPSLSEFEYPEGATQDGIDGAALYSTHESTLTDAGSLTLDHETTRTVGSNEFTETVTSEFGPAGIYREVEESGVTELVWSPTGEDQAYVQLSSGFDTVYRIDNQAPDNSDVTGLFEMRRMLEGVAWGEATDVVAAGDEFAVRYEATGVTDTERVAYGNTVESFAATISVTESGHVRELDYDLRFTRDGESRSTDATATLSSVGETTVEAPEWRDTAAENGVQFTSSLTDAGTAFRLEMTNGNEVSSDARLSLQDSGGRGDSSLQSALTTGDVLYVGLSEANELLMATDGTPDGARELRDYTRVALREGALLVLVSEQELR